jgi:uncharacterized protein YbjT (DUF2867 family)
MYLITGATGNIGNRAAKELLSKGKEVRVVSRHEDKMKELSDRGAEVLVGDVSDKTFVNRAFSGITAAYCMIPPNSMSKSMRKDQQIIARNYVDAVKTTGTKHVILLSSVGAHLKNGCGMVDGLADLESYFSELKEVNVLNLRPGFFMENLYMQLNIIKEYGMAGSPIKADLKLPVVATKDIAAVVERHLILLDFKGNTTEYVLGPKDLNFNEITNILGKAINKPDLKYKQFSKEEAKKGMIDSGYVSENVADLYTELYDSFNSGLALNAHTRTPQNSTSTKLEEFASNLAYAYEHSRAA